MKRVLVVEDNRLERKILLHILTKHFEPDLWVDEVSNGEHAIRYLEAQKYDLVITDLIMPRIEGLELIRIINDKYASTKLIAISGGNPYYLYMAKKLGIDGLFTKPLNISQFILKVEDLLKIKALEPLKT